MPTRYDVSRDELAAILDGEARFRVDQVWRGLYEQRAEPDRADRAAQGPAAPVGRRAAARAHARHRVGQRRRRHRQVAVGARRRRPVETVLMLYPDRATVCVSSQAGCAMGCGFCATGQAGFDRHLTDRRDRRAGRARAATGAARSTAGCRNVVFMGMGEPLANEDRVWAAVERLHGDLGLSARHLTISTVGIVPGIRRLADAAAAGEPGRVAARRQRRAARRAGADQPSLPARRRCIEACARLSRRQAAVGCRFEWALIDGVNDRRSRRRASWPACAGACVRPPTST